MNLVYGDCEKLNVTLAEKLKKEYHVVNIKPIGDDKYRYSSAYVNINAKDIDKDEVAMYAGMDELFDAEEFAAACVDYYGDRFWGAYVGILNKEEASEKINSLLDEPEEDENINK